MHVSDALPNFMSPSRRELLHELFLNDVTTISCLLWRNPAPWRLDWRKCHDTFLLFPLKGSFRVHLQGQSFVVMPGRYLLLPEDEPHRIELLRGHRELRQISLHCHLHDRWRRSIGSRISKFHGSLPHPGEAHRTLSELVCLMGLDPGTGQALGSMFLRNLLARHFHKSPPSNVAQAMGDPRVQRGVERMEEKYASVDLSVDEIARSVGLTAVHFRKLFRRDTGVSPKQFLQSLRLRRATWLLRHSDASVKEIAAQSGFASDHYFHLVFRNKFGSTPSEYRLGPPF